MFTLILFSSLFQYIVSFAVAGMREDEQKNRPKNVHKYHFVSFHAQNIEFSIETNVSQSPKVSSVD